jgi:hypothetical protein
MSHPPDHAHPSPADFYSSAPVDQINRFDHEAVFRQAKEYKF